MAYLTWHVALVHDKEGWDKNVNICITSFMNGPFQSALEQVYSGDLKRGHILIATFTSWLFK